MRQKGTPHLGRILKSKKCCDAQQLPDGGVGIGGHSIGWATSPTCRPFLMSALGQKQTSEHVHVMSALPPKADMDQSGCDVRFVPKADIRPGQMDLWIKASDSGGA